MGEKVHDNAENPVLHVLVVGFHHKKGCQVEYSFPPLVPDSSDESECPPGWKYLPTLALPDGSHNYDEDTVFFHLPSLTDPDKSIFGISCFRQIPVEKLKNRTADITRGTVQKSVCVLSRVPLYGQIEVKMALITHAYFEEGDFTKVALLADTYRHLNACLQASAISANSMLGDDLASQLFVGLSGRDLVDHWRHKALLLFKLLLLERKVVFFASPVRPLCATILSLLSLHPGMMETGLYQSACIRPSRPMSPVPHFDSAAVSTDQDHRHQRPQTTNSRTATVAEEKEEEDKEKSAQVLITSAIPISDPNRADEVSATSFERLEGGEEEKEEEEGEKEEETKNGVAKNSLRLEERDADDGGLKKGGETGGRENEEVLSKVVADGMCRRGTESMLVEEKKEEEEEEEEEEQEKKKKKKKKKEENSFSDEGAVFSNQNKCEVNSRVANGVKEEEKEEDKKEEEKKNKKKKKKKEGEDGIDSICLEDDDKKHSDCQAQLYNSNNGGKIKAPSNDMKQNGYIEVKKRKNEDKKQQKEERTADLVVKRQSDETITTPSGRLSNYSTNETIREVIGDVVTFHQNTNRNGRKVVKGIEAVDYDHNNDVNDGFNDDDYDDEYADEQQVRIASMPRDVSVETLGDVTAQNNMAAIAQMDAATCGVPLPIFTQGYLCMPYLSLPYLDLLSDKNIRGYVVGATNVLFKQKKRLADVLVEVDGAKIETADPELRRILHLSTEDLRFADYLVRHVTSSGVGGGSHVINSSSSRDVFLDGVGWEGGDEWLRAQFRVYLLCLLRTSLMPDGSRELDHYNAAFISAWRQTHSYNLWLQSCGDSILQLSAGHPFAGQLSVADMKLRITHTMQNTEGGRKLNQAMVTTGRAVATTGRAVGGAISHAKGALSSWWSNLTTAPSPTDPSLPGSIPSTPAQENGQMTSPEPGSGSNSLTATAKPSVSAILEV